MEVFYLQHVHTFENGAEDVKSIGMYSSRAEAEQAIQRLSSQPGFKEIPEGFVIDSYTLDKDHWEEGYVTVLHEPQSLSDIIALLADGCALEDVQPYFAQLLLRFGSETPDNLNCAEQVTIATYANRYTKRQQLGMALKRLGIPLSTLMNHIEDLALPESIQQEFPELTEAEWEAATRAITLTLLACEPSAEPQASETP
jgi:hypothetical protein